MADRDKYVLWRLDSVLALSRETIVEKNSPREELCSHPGLDFGKAPFKRMLREDKGESNEKFAQ
jgi:hypothetical protein